VLKIGISPERNTEGVGMEKKGITQPTLSYGIKNWNFSRKEYKGK
jgi:hypothetical protein